MGDTASLSNIHPIANPPHFFQRREFEGERGRAVVPPAMPDDLRIDSVSDVLRGELLTTFKQVTFDRFGVLKGEYVVLEHGLLLLDRSGDCIAINWPPENLVMARSLLELSNAEGLWSRRAEIVKNWDSLPLVEHCAVVSSPFSGNYVHCTLELVAGFRFFDRFDVRNILMAQHCLERRFQSDLISRAMGNRRVIKIAGPVRVKEPFLVHNSFSPDGLSWVRKTLGHDTKRGSKRYYIRRREDKRVIGNNLSESPGIKRLLDEHGFEPIDFGGGEHSVADQVRMLEGARIVLGAHGANLTNLAYLSPPLGVVEVFGPKRFSAIYMQISACLGFKHFALLCDMLDPNGDIVVDSDHLSALLKAAIG